MMTRRAFLSALALSAASCAPLIDQLTQPALPDTLTLPPVRTALPAAHLLNRATYGPRPGQVEQVQQMGLENWLTQQLDYENIADSAMDLRLRRYDTLSMTPRDLLAFWGTSDRRYIANELAAATLVRAVYSQRQLYEVMVGFWSDHFSMYHFKDRVAMLKTVDDREVIRPHALGNFGDLLRASAHSPAMLVYLDNIVNEKSHPNENYAREIMELHTLGVDGGYTEQDVLETARAFTGWSVNHNGEFIYINEWHDDGPKTILGHTLRADNGKADGERVLDILIQHPSTAQFICTRLARRFVADDPPADLVASCVATWRGSKGDIQSVLRTLFAHPDFASASPKIKRPFTLVASLLRATNATYNGDVGLLDTLESLGQRPFNWPTPDGYPDTLEAWNSNLLHRWNVGIQAVAGSLPGVGIDFEHFANLSKGQREKIPFFGRLLLQRELTDDENTLISQYIESQPTGNSVEEAAQVVGALLASPAFQWL